MGSELASLLNGFEPNPDAALREASLRITDDDLAWIATADYGYEVDEHLAALRQIHRTQRVPYPLPWEPKEVCELVRWGEFEPRRSSESAGPTQEELTFHHRRAFVCAVLLRHAFNDTVGYSMGENQTAAVLIDSALVLENDRPGLLSATRRTLAAVGGRADFADESERPFLALGVLLCVLAERARTTPYAPDGNKLRSLAESIIAAEQFLRGGGCCPRADWLLGVTFYDLRHSLWQSLARHVLVKPPHPHPAEADEVLRLIGGMLL